MRQRAPKRFIRPTNDASAPLPVEGTVTTTDLSAELNAALADRSAAAGAEGTDTVVGAPGSFTSSDGGNPYAVGTRAVA
jgi:hypothetical protein